MTVSFGLRLQEVGVAQSIINNSRTVFLAAEQR